MAAPKARESRVKCTSTAGKPVCAWDDPEARAALVDALARDGQAALRALEACTLSAEEAQGVAWLATVLGQDVEEAEGRFRIVNGVARDRVISTVDPDARHGHKTAVRGFDGYKGHVALDHDSELITATEVTAGNTADGDSAEALLSEWLSAPATVAAGDDKADTHRAVSRDEATRQVYGDTAYGTAHVVEQLEAAHIEPLVRVASPSMRDGKYSQDAFDIDHEAGTVRCPAGRVATLRERKGGSTIAAFAPNCTGCSLKDACTSATVGRRINLVWSIYSNVLSPSGFGMSARAWSAHRCRGYSRASSDASAASGAEMDWKTMLAYVTGSVDEELLRRNEYLVAENRILRTYIPGRVNLTDGQRRTLAEIGKRLGRKALAEVASIVQPETILAWHRRLVARKFDGATKRRCRGRPRIDGVVEELVVRFATENRDWGYDRIVGALANLRHEVSDQTVGNILKRHGIPPAPERKKTTTWKEFMRSPQERRRLLSLVTRRPGIAAVPLLPRLLWPLRPWLRTFAGPHAALLLWRTVGLQRPFRQVPGRRRLRLGTAKRGRPPPARCRSPRGPVSALS